MDEPVDDFSLTALYEALDAARAARDLSWAAVAREMCRRFPDGPTRTMSASTIAGVGAAATAEGDGVLQMLLWLGRTPESFAPGHPLADAPEALLPDPGDGHVLRFDTPALHAALDARRTERGLTWGEAATEVRLPTAKLRGLARAPRTGFPAVVRATTWLGRPAADFTRASPW